MLLLHVSPGLTWNEGISELETVGLQQGGTAAAEPELEAQTARRAVDDRRRLRQRRLLPVQPTHRAQVAAVLAVVYLNTVESSLHLQNVEMCKTYSYSFYFSSELFGVTNKTWFTEMQSTDNSRYFVEDTYINIGRFPKNHTIRTR